MQKNKSVSGEVMMEGRIKEYTWIGSQIDYVDQINVQQLSHVVIGNFGGNSSAGQYKNEDGCLVWTDQNKCWEFAVLLDAHHSAESAELVMNQINANKSHIQDLCNDPSIKGIKDIEHTIVNMFMDGAFLRACRKVKGETACLLVLRKEKYLWWFSVGDCLCYVFHPELAELGQYQVNQRHFYEWIGKVNTFEQSVPCYSSGVRELRKGLDRIFLTTDGLIECPNDPFASPVDIYRMMSKHSNHKGIQKILQTIQHHNVRDSTTIITWEVTVDSAVTRPSDEVDVEQS
ncbi:protein phosphatase 2C domain-containing protein [Ornithinibacillus hominis]